MQVLNLTFATEPSAQVGEPSPPHTGGGKYVDPSVFFPVGLLYTALLPSEQTGRVPSSQRWRLPSARARREAMAMMNFILLVMRPEPVTDYLVCCLLYIGV